MMTKRTIALLLLAAVSLSGCAGSGRKVAEPAQSPAVSTPEAKAPSGSAVPDTATVATETSAGRSTTMSAPATTTPPAWNEELALPPADMYYQDVGENPLVNTSKRPTSTFSVDVDTASFTLARNYLNRRMLPPPESIRVEEFINYFPQDYPRSKEPVTVYLEGSPSPYRPENYLIQIGLQARTVSESQRKPAILTFVVDVSGSMDMENRLGLVKRSLSMLLDELQADDRVALVVYSTKGEVVLEHTADKEKIRRAIDRLEPGGSTYAEEGIRLGYQLASRNFQESAINRVILCSDGVANVGRTGPDEILRQIEDYRDQGISLTTIGFGMGNYNDLLMERLADKGDGQYAYVDAYDEAKRVFREQLTGTLQMVAKDTKVQVYFDPEEVAAYRLVGYENRVMANQEFRNDRADAGDMGSGHTVTALYEVQLKGSGRVLGSVSLRYKDPESGEVTEKAFDMSRSVIFSEPSAHLLWSASVAEFAGYLSQSPWARESSLNRIIRNAERAADSLGAADKRQEMLEMMEQAAALQ